MTPTTRRDFIKLAGAASVAAVAFRNGLPLDAYPLGLPLGLQLYSLRELLPKDFDGTLKAIAGAGYTEVEAAGYYAMSAADFKQSMTTAGLNCVSGHYPLDLLGQNLENVLNYAKEAGLQYVVCSSPSLKDPSKVKVPPKDPGFHDAWMQAFTLDDWKWNAEQFNQIGGRVKGYGMKFGYHNHVAEFRKIGKTVGYDVLLQQTDPELVTFEMDCGWVSRRGIQPGGVPDEVPDAHFDAACEGVRPEEGDRASAVHGARTGQHRLRSNFCSGQKGRTPQALLRGAGGFRHASAGSDQGRCGVHEEPEGVAVSAAFGSRSIAPASESRSARWMSSAGSRTLCSCLG